MTKPFPRRRADFQPILSGIPGILHRNAHCDGCIEEALALGRPGMLKLLMAKLNPRASSIDRNERAGILWKTSGK